MSDQIRDISGRESYNPIFVDHKGSYRRIPDGAILNIGGIHSNTGFTVNGQAIMLADGSTTDGAGGISLQAVYNNSVPENGAARIKLVPGKSFSISDPAGETDYLVVDPNGKITILGELRVDSSIIFLAGAHQEADHWSILANDGSKVSLLIEPKQNVTYAGHVVRIRSSFDGPIDFSIDQFGDTYIRSLNVDTINGQPIGNLFNQLSSIQAALDAFMNSENSQILDLANKFQAIDTQLDGLDTRVTAIENQISSLSVTNVLGFEYTQNVPASTWTIIHNAGSNRVQFTVYEEMMRFIVPDDVIMLDMNTLVIHFAAEQVGKCIFTCLMPPVSEMSDGPEVPVMPA